MMAGTKQDRKDRWQRERVQRVLDYHNTKCETHIEIKGKVTDIYPHLKGQFRWDWVCYDTETGEEIAVEVKKITDPRLEERWNIMWQLLEEARNDLSNELPGTFSLYIDIPKNFYLPIGEIKETTNRQEFKNTLCKAICETAQRLKLGDEEALTPQIIRQLSFALPEPPFCALQKVSDKGSVLGLSTGVVGFWSHWLDEHELRKFETLVSRANAQLSQANVKETFLVIIEEGLRITHANTVAEALKHIDRNSYSYINHIYYVSGKEVTEITLPVTP